MKKKEIKTIGSNFGALAATLVSAICVVKLVRLRKLWATIAALTFGVDSYFRALKLFKRTNDDMTETLSDSLGFNDDKEEKKDDKVFGFDLRK